MTSIAEVRTDLFFAGDRQFVRSNSVTYPGYLP